MKNMIIIGNGAAGIAAVQAIRQHDKECAITVLTAESHPYFYKPRLAELIAKTVTEQQIIVYKEEWYRTNTVSVVYNSPVIAIDRNLKTVKTADSSYDYDTLLIATGAAAARPSVSGTDLPGVFVLRSFQDALSIAAFANTKPRVAVIGGGLLALEAAFNLHKLGCTISIIEILPRLLPRQLDSHAANLVQLHLERIGFTFYIADSVVAINGSEKVVSVTLKNSGIIAADMVLISAGITPNTVLAQQSGLTVNRGIVVNQSMQTADEFIYAAGDCCELDGRTWGLWPVAMKQGAIAGAGMSATPQIFVDGGNTTQLKITGVPLVSSGVIEDESGRFQTVIFEQDAVYRKVVIDNGRVAGFILLGNTVNHKQLTDLIQKQTDCTAIQATLADPAFNPVALT